ncbi:hypothetical protein [Kineococcus arenarius]|uniref:hypothetical protein n=1 Tax=Kineococcus sp. SYSU DK007 TaxID=3383128 RepID=UPI003D7D7DA3
MNERLGDVLRLDIGDVLAQTLDLRAAGAGEAAAMPLVEPGLAALARTAATHRGTISRALVTFDGREVALACTEADGWVVPAASLRHGLAAYFVPRAGSPLYLAAAIVEAVLERRAAAAAEVAA